MPFVRYPIVHLFICVNVCLYISTNNPAKDEALKIYTACREYLQI